MFVQRLHFRGANCNRAVFTLFRYLKRYTPYPCQQMRMSSSSSAQKEQEYCNILFKRFLFQIHPDFFSNYKKERAINEANIQKLTELIDKYSVHILVYTVYLIFLFKSKH
jgi:hypothetical protein